MIKNLFALLVLLAVAVPGFAQADVKIINANLDVSATSYTYYLYSDERPTYPGGALAAVAASTTIKSTTDAITGMAVGDLVSFPVVDVVTTRRITTWTSANSIAISGAAVTIPAGTPMRWRQRSGGTGANSGAFVVSGYKSGRVHFDLVTINATSIEVRMECRAGSGLTTWDEIWTVSKTAVTTIGETYPWNEADSGFTECRVGTKVSTDGGAQDVSVAFYGVRK